MRRPRGEVSDAGESGAEVVPTASRVVAQTYEQNGSLSIDWPTEKDWFVKTETTDTSKVEALSPRLLLHADAVAELLSVKPSAVRNLHRSGRLRGVICGRELRFKMTAVRAYVAGLGSGGCQLVDRLPDIDGRRGSRRKR